MQIFRLVGIVPAGVGVTLLIGLWFPGSPFDFAPLFFKIFGSFVALMFILVGSVFLSGALSPERRLKSMLSVLQKLQREQLLAQESNQTAESHAEAKVVAGYQCTTCGATLDAQAEVSPHGDVKCAHCGRWFNIHKS